MSKALVLVLLSIYLQIAIAQGQTSAQPPPPSGPNPPGSGGKPDLGNGGFLTPIAEGDDQDVFIQGAFEYLFLGEKIHYRYANELCNQKSAKLAPVLTEKDANFLAVALSETNLHLDTLWVAGTFREGKWFWQIEEGNFKEINATVVKTMVSSVSNSTQECLGFGRLNHDAPQYRPLNCHAMRSVICVRPSGGGGSEDSTHTGWIPGENKEYKIFAERVTYSMARFKCKLLKEGGGSDLAVISKFDTAQHLGRHLLIGRPSLENAWIQAKYENNKFMYDTDPNVVLSNKSDSTGFPPWREGVIQKAGGCVLLDRHLANISLFIEARCERLRPYICSVASTNKSDKIDAIIGDKGYRLILRQLPFDDALEFCKTDNPKYPGKLVEPETMDLVNDLIYFMGEYRITTQHIWIGGYTDSNKTVKWVWKSSGKDIDAAILTKYGVKNTTYKDKIEKFNVCLNFDRENHNVVIIYGTICDYPQSFVCTYPKAEFLKLLEEEAKGTGSPPAPGVPGTPPPVAPPPGIPPTVPPATIPPKPSAPPATTIPPKP